MLIRKSRHVAVVAADVIVMPYRPVNVDDGSFSGQDELIITKQRNGSIGSIPMAYNTQNLCFESRKYAL